MAQAQGQQGSSQSRVPPTLSQDGRPPSVSPEPGGAWGSPGQVLGGQGGELGQPGRQQELATVSLWSTGQCPWTPAVPQSMAKPHPHRPWSSRRGDQRVPQRRWADGWRVSWAEGHGVQGPLGNPLTSGVAAPCPPSAQAETELGTRGTPAPLRRGLQPPCLGTAPAPQPCAWWSRGDAGGDLPPLPRRPRCPHFCPRPDQSATPTQWPTGPAWDGLPPTPGRTQP